MTAQEKALDNVLAKMSKVRATLDADERFILDSMIENTAFEVEQHRLVIGAAAEAKVEGYVGAAAEYAASEEAEVSAHRLDPAAVDAAQGAAVPSVTPRVTTRIEFDPEKGYVGRVLD